MRVIVVGSYAHGHTFASIVKVRHPMDTIVIAVDVMGGDNGPAVVLEGCEQALAQDSQLSLALVGAREVVEPFAASHERCVAYPTTQIIDMGEHPAQAVRKKKDSSLVVGCRLVKEGAAQGFFSAGSTGACLAAATLVIGRIKGVARPALCIVLPTPAKPVLLCDVGANADCKPSYLVQFTQMATVFAQKVVGVADPSVALLNIGSEDTKGSLFAQESFKLLREQVPNFKGNGEGGDMTSGAFDIFVTDGFTGNVALKSIEGTLKLMMGQFKEILMASTKTKLAAMLVKGGLRDMKHRLDPDTYGGSPLLGVKGACIVGHGNSSAKAVKNGIITAADYVRSGVTEDIACAVASRSHFDEGDR